MGLVDRNDNYKMINYSVSGFRKKYILTLLKLVFLCVDRGGQSLMCNHCRDRLYSKNETIFVRTIIFNIVPPFLVGIISDFLF